jgi:hypothetical protein
MRDVQTRALHSTVETRALHSTVKTRALHSTVETRALHSTVETRALHSTVETRALHSTVETKVHSLHADPRSGGWKSMLTGITWSLQRHFQDTVRWGFRSAVS